VLAVLLQVPVPTSTQTTVVAGVLPDKTPVTVISYVPVVVEPVVAAVSVEVCAVALLKVSEAGETPHVTGLAALEGEVVTEQESATVPVNELAGVTVMVAVPVAPWPTVMLPLLESEKLLLLLLGACQKSPQPARSVAAANNPIQRPIFIAAPRTQYSGYTRTRSPTLF
jgi:hypothetical protein